MSCSNASVAKPDEVWVAEITYMLLASDFLYLAVLMDVFTRQVRSSELSRSFDGCLTLNALDRALRQAKPTIPHSDQGVLYTANDYVERLWTSGVSIIMDRIGSSEENGYAERLIRSINLEEAAISDNQDFADARGQLGAFLDKVYNRKRIDSTLGYLTPRRVRQPLPHPTNRNLSSESPSRGIHQTEVPRR